MPTVSVVIPTLNEALNLEHVLPALPADLHEVLIVDGNSTDDTIAVAQRLRPDVRIVFEQRKGKGAALRAGFAAATGDIIVAMDADGSTDPRELPAFVAALMHGSDFAKGSRFLPGGGSADITWLRALGNRAFVGLVRVLFGARYTDLCYGYNAFWRRNLPLLGLRCDGFEIETEMNVRALAAGLRVVEVPSYEHARVYGASNLRAFRDGWRVVSTIFTRRFSRHSEVAPSIDGIRSLDRQPIVMSSIGARDTGATRIIVADFARGPSESAVPGSRAWSGRFDGDEGIVAFAASMHADAPTSNDGVVGD